MSEKKVINVAQPNDFDYVWILDVYEMWTLKKTPGTCCKTAYLRDCLAASDKSSVLASDLDTRSNSAPWGWWIKELSQLSKALVMRSDDVMSESILSAGVHPGRSVRRNRLASNRTLVKRFSSALEDGITRKNLKESETCQLCLLIRSYAKMLHATYSKVLLTL